MAQFAYVSKLALTLKRKRNKYHSPLYFMSYCNQKKTQTKETRTRNFKNLKTKRYWIFSFLFQRSKTFFLPRE